ncbi:hypothetical protein KBY27_09975 [Ruegeria pomeroyi]|uniref:Uncharacterized protein n=1 Tax=Ruegeria pomeroyi TaxID=89184 RepID=A0A9Q3WKK7_9RHOB|nr:hypothetical protein [Ruegeria pomeroyi]MCE8537786.1 hypothetical protein [Ruegeria pomeroyi]
MPQTEWILDVLSDLKTFANANGLSALAEQLDDTKIVAAAEIASKREEALSPTHGQKGQPEPDFGGLGRHQSA